MSSLKKTASKVSKSVVKANRSISKSIDKKSYILRKSKLIRIDDN